VPIEVSVTEALRRLQKHVRKESVTGAIIGERANGGYVGSFEGTVFRFRMARPMSQFYATYLYGEVKQHDGAQVITFRFGHRTSATWALWIIRLVGALIVATTLVAALQQPVFVFGAVFVAVGIGLLLWAYRLRPDDKERLRSLLVTSTRRDSA
jgi:hypothetical protein